MCIVSEIFLAAIRSSGLQTSPISSRGSAAIKRRRIFISSSLSGSPRESLMRKRSSWASGSGNVPLVSTGFCVAMTKNGSSSFLVSPSTVTCRSSIHSRRPDWVLGVARLISSARRMLVKTGPLRNSNFPLSLFQIERPVTSDGRRSGVNWILMNRPPTDLARAFASVVFPVPGRSSRRTWPPARSAMTLRRVVSSRPTRTRLIFSRRRRMCFLVSIHTSGLFHNTYFRAIPCISPDCSVHTSGSFHAYLRAVPYILPVLSMHISGLLHAYFRVILYKFSAEW